MTLHAAKQILRAALTTATDEKLAEMLAFAQDGKMVWGDICGCFAGSLLASHVHSNSDCDPDGCSPYTKAYGILSKAYQWLSLNQGQRQRRIIPMIKAQMRIRASKTEKTATVEKVLVLG